jgi:hypothetical protein
LFADVKLIDWTNNDFYDNMSEFFEDDQILSIIARDNVFRSMIDKDEIDPELVLNIGETDEDEDENEDVYGKEGVEDEDGNENFEEDIGSHDKKKKTMKFKIKKTKPITKKGKVYIMSVKRGISWPEKRFKVIDNLGGPNKVLQVNVTSQNVKYRNTFSPMLIPESGNYKNGFYCFENWYQSGKVLKDIPRDERLSWWKNQTKGFRKYPKTDFSVNPVIHTQWEEFGDKTFDYIESRKIAYVPEYWKLINDKEQFLQLKSDVENGMNIIVIDQDGPYSIEKREPTIEDINIELLRNKINYTRDPFGHGYIVAAGLLNIDINQFIN